MPPLDAIKYAKLCANLGSCWLNYAEMSQLLLPMRSLRHLDLCSELTMGGTEVPANHALINLPSLLSLNVNGFDSVGSLRFLNIPNVRILTFQGPSSQIIYALSEHHRLYPRVQSLRLIGELDYSCNVLASTVRDLVSLLPNIRSIIFLGADPTHILNALCVQKKPTDELLWPHLSAITVKMGNGANIALKKKIWACIVKIVDNWCQLGAQISRIKLSSQIVERGTERQKQLLREHVILTEF